MPESTAPASIEVDYITQTARGANMMDPAKHKNAANAVAACAPPKNAPTAFTTAQPLAAAGPDR